VLTYTVITPGLHWLRVDLYSSQPTPYKFVIKKNGQTIGTFYDTAVDKDTGLTAQQFRVNSVCNVRITYDGPIYSIYLFKPGADIVYSTPTAQNLTSVNPKQIVLTLPFVGLWSIVIDHAITSTTSTYVFRITV